MEQLSGLDAAFLYLEAPAQPMHVVLCTVLDPATAEAPLTLERLREHVVSRFGDLPLLTRHVVEVPLRLGRPYWAHDPDVDVHRHVFEHTLATPGGEPELEAFTADLASRPLERDRPLWEFWLVDGLANGKVAAIAKVHHAMLDGVAGVGQLVALFDFEPNPPATEPTAVPSAEAIPGDLELASIAAVERIRSLPAAIPVVGRAATSLWGIGRSRRQPEVTPGATPLVTPSSPVNGIVTGDRSVAFARISVDGVRHIRKAVDGATYNDVLLAACAGALRTYLVRHDAPVDRPLVAVCPVDVRREDQQGHVDNRISAMFVELPVGEPDALARLERTVDASNGAKSEHQLLGDDLFQELADIADPNALRWGMRLYTGARLSDFHPPAVNLVVSNVPGPPVPLYLLGHRLERVIPMGQIAAGVGLNITVMSYCDAIDVGFLAAANLAPDLHVLRDAFTDAFDELCAAID